MATASTNVVIRGTFDPHCAEALRVEVSYQGDDGAQHVAVANASGYGTSVFVDPVPGEAQVTNRATFSVRTTAATRAASRWGIRLPRRPTR